MKLEGRAYDKKRYCMLHNLEIDEDGHYIGREEGTETWVKRHVNSLILQQETNERDVLLRPIFEGDVLRDKDGNQYRVLYYNKVQGLILYDMEKRQFYPLERTNELEVIGHIYTKCSELTKNKDKLFPEPIIFNDLEELEEAIDQNQSNKSRSKNPMINNQPITRSEALEIPSFIGKQKEKYRHESNRNHESNRTATPVVAKSIFGGKRPTRLFNATRETAKR